jgi:hypothetical protein
MASVGLLAAFARALQLVQAPPQGLNLPLISIALPLKILQRLQNLIHLLKTFFKCTYDIIHLFDGGLDAGLGSRLRWTRMRVTRRLWFGGLDRLRVLSWQCPVGPLALFS